MIGKTPRERFIIEQAVYFGLAFICGVAAIIFGLMNPGDKRRHYAYILGGFVLFRGAIQAFRAIEALKPQDGWLSLYRASRRQPPAPATQSYGACPMCGASIVIPGTCAECGETVVNPHAPNPDAESESN